MRSRATLPRFDALEPRRLLAVAPLAVPTLPTTSAAALRAVPMKKVAKAEKDAEKADDGNGQGNGKKPAKKAPEITLLIAPAWANLTDGTSTVPFGQVLRGAPAPARTFVIRNDGRATLTVGPVSVPPGFALVDAPAGRVAAGKFTTFTVRMDAAAPGPRGGRLTVASNDADESSFDVALTGTVTAPTAPAAALEYAGRPAPADTVIDFGTVAAGMSLGAAPVRTVTVRNDGTAPLVIGRLALPAGFALIDGPDPSLAPGDSDTITLRLSPTVIGPRSGDLTLATSDPAHPTLTLRLTGQVIAPPPTPAPTPPPPTPTPTPTPTPAPIGPRAALYWVPPRRSAVEIVDGQTAPIAFPAGVVGGPAPLRLFRAANTGDRPLAVGHLSLPPGFIWVDGLGAAGAGLTLAPGQTADFTVALDTASAAARAGQVRLTTADPAAPIFNFAVAGTVTAPPPPPAPLGGTATFNAGTLTVTGTAGDDDIVFAGRSAALTVTIGGRSAGGPFADVAKVVVYAGYGNDRVDASAVYVNGTFDGGPGDDAIDGSQADDVLIGGPGADSLRGLAGSDFLLGGDGDDTLVGGPGLDSLQGDAGDDLLDAIDGLADARLDGGAGNNVLRRDRVDPLA